MPEQRGGGERAARLRAIRGYAGFDQPGLARKLGVSVTTMSRLENGRAGIEDDLLERAARICRVPLVFAAAGFAPLERPITNVEMRLHELERRMERERQEMLAEVAKLAGEAVAQALESGELPTSEGGSSKGSDQAAG